MLTTTTAITTSTVMCLWCLPTARRRGAQNCRGSRHRGTDRGRGGWIDRRGGWIDCRGECIRGCSCGERICRHCCRRLLHLPAKSIPAEQVSEFTSQVSEFTSQVSDPRCQSFVVFLSCHWFRSSGLREGTPH
eukprot:940783-Pyramimonas_sp.AAC.2